MEGHTDPLGVRTWCLRDRLLHHIPFCNTWVLYQLINKTFKEIRIVKDDVKWARFNPTVQNTGCQVGTPRVLGFLLNRRSPEMIIKEAGN